MTLDVAQTRNRIIVLLTEKGFAVQTSAQADWGRDGKPPKDGDVEFTIGTVYGEVTVMMKGKNRTPVICRVTNESTLDGALRWIDQEIERANYRLEHQE